MGTWSLLVVLLISCAASLEKKCPSNILNKFLSDPRKAKEHYDNGETVSVTCLADSGDDWYDYSNDDGSDGLDTKNIRVLNCTDGKWIGHYPECFSNCSKPDIYAIMNPEYEVYAPGDNVTITACKKDNARIEGDTTLICMADGIWIGSAKCPKQHNSCNKQPPTISNAYITDAVLDEYKHGTVLRYKCSQAFDQMVKHSVTCNDGHWIPDSANLTICIIGHCSHIDSREIGYMHVKKISGQVGTYAEFECHDGYELDGSANILCMADRKWYPEIPKCKPISCPPPKQILNGRLLQEAYNGLLNIYQSTIRYDCDMGYRIVGPRFRKCQSDRTWSGNDTKCEEIVCEKPSPPENGTVYLTDNSQKVGSQIEYICDEHHVMEPIASKFAICTVHGHWSSPQPRCIKICNVRALSHGSINDIFGRKVTEKPYVLDKTELTFTCYKGYEKYACGYEPRRLLKCVNYTLHPGSPECKPQRCFIEPPINLEYFMGQEKVLENYIHSGTEMNARCSNRTELFGSSSYLEREQESVKCNFGKLEPGSLVCMDKRCNIITTIDNGHFINRWKVVLGTGEKIQSGTSILLKCSEGYELYNKTNSMYLKLVQTDIKCYQGSFTTEIPSCEPKRCFIEPTTNLEYFIRQEKVLENYIHSGIVVNARCSNRTELFGSSSYLEREQVYVKCNLGKLEPESPVCKDKRCRIEPPVNMEYFIEGEKVLHTYIKNGTIMQARCSDRMERVLSSSYLDNEETFVQCISGTLEPRTLECKGKRCDINTTIDNGHFRNRGKVVVPGEKIISGSNITLICSKGYELYNKKNSMYLDLEQTDIKCYQSSFTPEIPSCEPKRCRIEPPVNMEYFIEGEKVLHKYIDNGTIIQARCPDRMELVLSSSYLDIEQTLVQCILGTLEPRTLECKGKRCKITAIDNGHFLNRGIVVVTGEKIHSGSNIQLKCSVRYELYNKTNSMYLDLEQTDIKCYQGSFTPEISSCEPKRCDIITTIDNGHFRKRGEVVVPGEKIISGSNITLICSEKYELYNKTNSMHLDLEQMDITCYQGSFTPEIMSCEPNVKGCVLKDPGMHFISLSNRTVLNVGENANVLCKFGYQIVPNISPKPAYENDYPVSESTADPSKMPETEDTENLIPVSDGNYTCRDNGKLEPDIRFSCKQIICDSFYGYNLENGHIFYSSHYAYTVGTVASFRCNPGYVRDGPETRTCQIDGTWSGEYVTCQRTPHNQVTGCILREPGMHFLSLGNRTVLKVGENANVSCKFGYQIVPNISVKREYDYPDPESTADPSEMPETEDNENLKAVSDGNYTCIDNGKWEPELRFSCKQIMCDSFEKYNLENGNIIDSTHGVDTVGTVVSFQCNPGYTRHGPETRTCQTDGTWSGKCVTCQMDGRNASITCPAPCVPEGARKTGSHTYEKGSTVKFHCPRSKTQDRDYRRNIRHCIIKDEYVSWNGTQINCKEIICDKGDHYGFENGIVTYSSSSAYVSTVASFRCNPGYKRRGPKTRICQKDGTWSGECVTCQKHQPSSSTCPAPCVPDGAIKIGSRSYEIGSIIQLYCFQSNMNYNVQNSYIRHCVNDGKSASWNGTNINCKVKCEPLTDTYNVVQTGVVPGILSDKTIVELNCNGSLAPVKAECRKGHWHPKKPTCKYTCSLSAVEGTLYKYNVAKDQVFLDAIESGRQIKVICEDGFLPNTQNYDVSSCVNGVWKPEIVKCNKT